MKNKVRNNILSACAVCLVGLGLWSRLPPTKAIDSPKYKIENNIDPLKINPLEKDSLYFRFYDSTHGKGYMGKDFVVFHDNDKDIRISVKKQGIHYNYTKHKSKDKKFEFYTIPSKNISKSDSEAEFKNYFEKIKEIKAQSSDSLFDNLLNYINIF